MTGEPIDWMRATLEDLHAFLALALHETATLDYKRDLSGDVPETIAAMANTEGGVIIVGVDEDKATKTPRDRGGFSSPDPQGTLANMARAYLSPMVPFETHVIVADAPQLYLIVVVHPMTNAVILHRDCGIKVRVQDQSVAPDRAAFLALIGREIAASTQASDLRNIVLGRAGSHSGPGQPETPMRIYASFQPLRRVDLPPSDQLDDALATVASQLIFPGFEANARPDSSGAVRPDMEYVSIDRQGLLDAFALVQRNEWKLPGRSPWLVNASDLASDLMAVLLLPFALREAHPSADILPAAVAAAVSSYSGKALSLGLPRLEPAGPIKVEASYLTRSSTLAERSDAYKLAVALVRDLTRLYQQRGADIWAESLPRRLPGLDPRLGPWEAALLS